MHENQNYVEFKARSDQNQEIINLKVPFNSTFNEVIHSLQKAFNKEDISYFEYLDEDNDNVIVSSEEELQSVFLYYYELTKDSLNMGLSAKPLQVSVKTGTCDPNNSIAESPKLTISLEYRLFPNERDYISNNSSKSHSGSISSGGLFISTQFDDRASPMFDDSNADMNTQSHSSISPALCEEHVYIMGEIGSGSTGRVVRALHTPTQRVIAIKIIELDTDSDHSVKAQIIAELAVLKLARDAAPHIIEYYGAFFVDSSIYICTEFMDGHSLDHYGIIESTVLIKLIGPIVDGLRYLWARKIIHRDVKPSNMLINTRGQLKLCDFGISKQLVHSVARTYTGTIAFMSPERLKGDAYRISSDVWSLGISVHLMGSGLHPFIDLKSPVSPASVLQSVFESTGPRLATSVFSADMLDFIGRCVEKEPADRFDAVSILHHPIYLHHHGSHAALLAQWVCEHAV